MSPELPDEPVVLGPAELVDLAAAWPVVDSTVLAQGHISAFVQDTVATPDGDTMSREYLRHPGAVGIIALDELDRVVLVRQYRHPVRHRLVEPPAGLLDKHAENPLAAARRELAEEVGLSAGRWHLLVDLYTTPGISAESLLIFLARDLEPADAPEGFVRHGEEAEMDTVRARLDDLVDAILDGRLHNPTLVSGVLAAAVARTRDGFAGLRDAGDAWPADVGALSPS